VIITKRIYKEAVAIKIMRQWLYPETEAGIGPRVGALSMDFVDS